MSHHFIIPETIRTFQQRVQMFVAKEKVIVLCFRDFKSILVWSNDIIATVKKPTNNSSRNISPENISLKMILVKILDTES